MSRAVVRDYNRAVLEAEKEATVVTNALALDFGFVHILKDDLSPDDIKACRDAARLEEATEARKPCNLLWGGATTLVRRTMKKIYTCAIKPA